MVLVDKATMSTPKEWWVMVKGHPHLDDGGSPRLRGIAADADEHLRQWQSDADGSDDETAPPPSGDDRE